MKNMKRIMIFLLSFLLTINLYSQKTIYGNVEFIGSVLYKGLTPAITDSVVYINNGVLTKGLKPSGTDSYTVKYDALDPTAGYIADKFVAGTNISLAEGTGGNENKLVISSTGGTAIYQSHVQYFKYFSSGSQMPNVFDSNPLMTDIYNNPTSINGGYQNNLSSTRGVFVATENYNKVKVSGFLRPYNVGGGNPAPIGTSITFTIHFVQTTATGRSVVTTTSFSVLTTQTLNQNQGQGANAVIPFNFTATLGTPLTAGQLIGTSLTTGANWGVIGNLIFDINYIKE